MNKITTLKHRDGVQQTPLLSPNLYYFNLRLPSSYDIYFYGILLIFLLILVAFQ